MIQPAKVNFNKAMFVVVLAFGLVSTLVLLSDPLKPENDEIPVAARKTTDDMFETVETSIARSMRPADNNSNIDRAPASENSQNSKDAIDARSVAQNKSQNPFGVNSVADGFDIDCTNPPSQPLQTQAARVKVQLNHCPLEGLKIINSTNGFEGMIFQLGASTAVTDLINLVDQENEIEISSPQINVKFKVLNSLPKK